MHFASETSKHAKVTEGEPVIARESILFSDADRGNLRDYPTMHIIALVGS